MKIIIRIMLGLVLGFPGINVMGQFTGSQPSAIAVGNSGNVQSGASVFTLHAPTRSSALFIADANKAEAEFVTTNNVTFVHATNGTASKALFSNIYLWGGPTNRTVVFPANWTFFGCTATNTLRSNVITCVHLRFRGPTTNAATQTNVFCKIEEQ